jgi:hypothetical protein
MNRYSEEEIWALVDKLKWYLPPDPEKNRRKYPIDPRHANDNRIVQYDCMNTELVWDYDDNKGNKHTCKRKIDLSEFLSYMVTGKVARRPDARDFWFDIIFKTPLEQVPLYINEHPEICAWRLEIAK